MKTAIATFAAVFLIVLPSYASDCWRTVIPIGVKSQDGRADLFTSKEVAIDADKGSSIRAAISQSRTYVDKDPEHNIAGTPDSYQVGCESPAKEQTSPSPARKFIEETLEKGLAVLLIANGVDPEKSILVAVAVKAGTIKIMDAYDRDRGDVKAFLEKVGAEVNPAKLDEWLKDPANSFARSDLGKATEQAKDSFNRGDISKVTGIKF